jgi:hypothetical protein
VAGDRGPDRRRAPPNACHRSNSKVATRTRLPRISGWASTHFCRSERSRRPASASAIGCAGVAADPVTVKTHRLGNQATPDASHDGQPV